MFFVSVKRVWWLFSSLPEELFVKNWLVVFLRTVDRSTAAATRRQARLRRWPSLPTTTPLSTERPRQRRWRGKPWCLSYSSMVPLHYSVVSIICDPLPIAGNCASQWVLLLATDDKLEPRSYNFILLLSWPWCWSSGEHCRLVTKVPGSIPQKKNKTKENSHGWGDARLR